MIDLLKNQRIAKRKYYGPAGPIGRFSLNSRQDPGRKRKFKEKPAFRPERILLLSGRNSRFIEKVKQNPLKVSHSVSRLVSGRKSAEFPPRFFEKPEKTGVSRISSMLLPALSAAGLFAVVLGIVFILQSQGGSFDWTGRNVVSSERDQSVGYNLARYAGLDVREDLNENQGAGGESIPLDLTETFEWKSYRVRKGDSVSKIAAAFSISMDAVIASNGITNARALREGETLRIPNMDGIPYTVKSGDNLSGISKSMGVPLEAILDANDIQSDKINTGMTLFIPGARMNREELKLALGELFVYPIRGAKLSSPFGWRDDPISGVRRHHAALDLSAPQGTPVTAAMDGKVLAVGFNATYGNYIILSHPGSYQTMYAHLHTTAVKKGDAVSQGAGIGSVGNTGYSTGPHLHFAIFKNSRPVNPLDFLNPKK